MNMVSSIFFVLVTTLLYLDQNGIVLGANFPPGIEFCHKSDSNFNNCVAAQMTKALNLFKDGVPELGVPRLDPFEIPKMELLGNSGATVSLIQKYFNSLTSGISKSSVYDAKYVINENECYWDFMVLSPLMVQESDYELNGQLLVFPINGHGKCKITITNLRNHHKAQCELYKKKGKTYIRITKYEQDMQPETISYSYENIMPGNKQVSEDLLKTMNDNSQEIFREVKPGFQAVWAQLHMQTANNVLAKIPADEIFPE